MMKFKCNENLYINGELFLQSGKVYKAFDQGVLRYIIEKNEQGSPQTFSKSLFKKALFENKFTIEPS